jgi:predicted acetyltransferase
MTTELRLRPLRVTDEAAALQAHAWMAKENFAFLLGHESSEPWDNYVRTLDERSRGFNLAPGWVSGTLLVAVVNDELVGRASIRHELNVYLALAGGHIGYCVLPPFRGRGFATEILRQSVIIARSKGIDRVLLTCDLDNSASARVIEKCDGVFESTVDDVREGVQKRRYWIG